MRLPVIRGVIERRMLVNYRVDPTIAARLLPPPFRPQLVGGFAVAGICLIRLAGVRPRGLPAFVGVGSENAAHRFAVEWDEPGRGVRTGVYVPRRDSSSRLNAILGGRVVPGEHRHARFDVDERDERLAVGFTSDDGTASVRVVARPTDAWPADSIFADAAGASRFFAGGSLGYSATNGGDRFDGLELRCETWATTPLAVESATSSFFDDPATFPAGAATLDCALLMRGVAHEWHAMPPIAAGDGA